MKRKALIALLVLEAAACIAFCFARISAPMVVSSSALPFVWAGTALRSLSLSGGAGNITAIVLYAVISLLPVFTLLLIRRKRKPHPEDALLVLLSVCLFGVLYLMINPGLITSFLGEIGGSEISQTILCTCVYSVLVGYLILRVLRLFFAGITEKLQKYLSVMLALLNALFVAVAFGGLFGDLLDSFALLRESNQGFEDQLGLSYGFLTLQYLAAALPYALDIAVAFSAMDLLVELKRARYSETAIARAHSLSRLCGKVLAVTVLSAMGFNLLQLLFARQIHNISFSLDIPLLSVAFVLAALLLARYIEENKRLKDDNDLFISGVHLP